MKFLIFKLSVQKQQNDYGIRVVNKNHNPEKQRTNYLI